MRYKYLIALLLVTALLVSSCAKRSTAWKENEVVSLLARVPVIGNPIDLVVSPTHAFVALDQGGFSTFDLNTHEQRWYTSILATDGSVVSIRRIKNISIVPEHNVLFVNEVEGTDGIKIISTADMDTLKQTFTIMGGTQNLRHMEFHSISSPFMGVDVEGMYSISSNVSRATYNSSAGEWLGATNLFTSIATAQGIDFTEEYVYIAAQQRGLVIFDREQGQIVGEVAFPGEAQRVQIMGNYAYVASRQGGLNVVDITDHNNPVWISNFSTVGYATGVDALNDMVVIASNSGGAYLFDVTNPHEPKLLQRITSCGYANDARFYGNNIVVAGRDEGMLFYRIVR